MSERRAASVWDTGRVSMRQQLKHHYVDATRGDTTALTPAVAHRIIATYTTAGDTVLDPHPGAGITLTEALRAGRHAIGIDHGTRWQATCQANLNLARSTTPTGDALLLDGPDDPRAGELSTAVDLVLTALPHTPAHGLHRAIADLCTTLTAVLDWVWPGGHIVITCPPCRHHTTVIDIPSQLYTAARAIGLIPLDHCIALTAPLRAGAVRPRHRRTATAPHGDSPVSLAAHLDVLVFTVPPRHSAHTPSTIPNNCTPVLAVAA